MRERRDEEKERTRVVVAFDDFDNDEIRSVVTDQLCTTLKNNGDRCTVGEWQCS
jgi:hypothetical protein